MGSEDRFMLHLIQLKRFVLRNACTSARVCTHTHLCLVSVAHVFALLPYSAHGGVMIHGALYGLHLLLTGHIHLPFIESTWEVRINIHSRNVAVYDNHSTVVEAVPSYSTAICKLPLQRWPPRHPRLCPNLEVTWLLIRKLCSDRRWECQSVMDGAWQA